MTYKELDQFYADNYSIGYLSSKAGEVKNLSNGLCLANQEFEN